MSEKCSDKCIVCKQHIPPNQINDMCVWCTMFRYEAERDGILFVWGEVQL